MNLSTVIVWVAIIGAMYLIYRWRMKEAEREGKEAGKRIAEMIKEQVASRFKEDPHK